MRMDKGHWLRCLLWHGWLPTLSGVNGAFPWAASASERAGYLFETALGCYSSGSITELGHPDGYCKVDVASLVPFAVLRSLVKCCLRSLVDFLGALDDSQL